MINTEAGVRAYWNVCAHVPVPLDGGLGSLPMAGLHVVCTTHGATYRPNDGFCEEGPCQGESLIALDVEMKDGVAYANAVRPKEP